MKMDSVTMSTTRGVMNMPPQTTIAKLAGELGTTVTVLLMINPLYEGFSHYYAKIGAFARRKIKSQAI